MRYGRIEIGCDGQISGDVQAEPAEFTPDVASVRVAS
jgi:hypothetical protein